jgi:hypothetical protein
MSSAAYSRVTHSDLVDYDSLFDRKNITAVTYDDTNDVITEEVFEGGYRKVYAFEDANAGYDAPSKVEYYLGGTLMAVCEMSYNADKKRITRTWTRYFG